MNDLHEKHQNIFDNQNHILEITDIHISMINLNIHIDWIINKMLLYKILQEENCHVRWNRNNNIILEFTSSNKQHISITIYQKSMIISNCLNESDIIEVYEFLSYHVFQKKNK